jgi:hypothetical protein
MARRRPRLSSHSVAVDQTGCYNRAAMGMVRRTLRCFFFPRWLTRPTGRLVRRLLHRIAYRLVQVLTLATAGALVFLLWRGATYDWPMRPVVRRVAATAGVAADDRSALIAALQAQGFQTLTVGMARAEVQRRFAAAHAEHVPAVGRDAFYFNFAGEHQFGFFPEYDTADRLVALTWQYDFLMNRRPELLAIHPSVPDR